MSETITYRPLEPEFTKTGFRFRQLRREGDIAIFHKVASEGNTRPKAHDAGFETVVITRHDGYEIAGVKMEPAECYPSSEMWGTKGWSYQTLFEAELKYERLLGRLPEEVAPAVPETVEKEESEDAPTERKARKPRGEVVKLNIPDGEFTTKELAAFNNVEYPIAFVWLKEAVEAGSVKPVGERKVEGQRGKASKTYSKV